MEHSINILKKGMIKSCYVNANRYLISKYNTGSDSELDEAWRAEYDAKLVENHIVFASNQSKIMFVLRWGD